MRWQLGGVFAAAAAMLVSTLAPAAAAAQQSSHAYSVKVVEIDRAGRTVSYDDVGATQVVGGLGQYFTGTTNVLKLPAGTYVIAADIETLDSSSQLVSQTLAAVVRTIRRSMTITLDARSGRAVTEALTVPGAVEQDRTGTVCARMIDDYVAPVAWAGPLYGYGLGQRQPIPLYEVPVTAKYIQFNDASQFSAAGGMYYVEAEADGRLPYSPTYSFAARDLAKVTVEEKSGTTAGGPGAWQLSPGTSCNDYGFDLSPGQTSSRVTQYVSAGKWTATYLQADGVGSDSWHRTYARQRSYVDVFGGAVRGPIEWLPVVEQRELFYWPNELLGDPNQSGAACCARATVTLKSGAKILKRSTVGTFGQFDAPIRHAGWYDLKVDAKQAPPSSLSDPPLSTRIVLSWHAYVGSLAMQTAGTLPVSLARFQPQGLDMANNAAPGGRTVTRIYLDRIGVFGIPPPRRALGTVRMAVSYNGGRSWQQLRVSRKSRYWSVTIPDPATGYVSLRSTVTDVQGNRSVETIYRAYGVG